MIIFAIQGMMTFVLRLQGFQDAQTPESVLSLVDSLHVQAVKSAELLGEKERQLAAQKGG